MNNFNENIEYLKHMAHSYATHHFLGRATLYSYIENVTRFTNKLKNKFPNRPNSQIRVLDWGCGKGHITYLLKSRGFSVTSCDIASQSPDSSFCQDTPIISDQNIHVERLSHDYLLPFEDNSFDAVVSFGVLEHVANDCASLKEIARITNNQGLFYFCMLPTIFSWTQRLAHIRGDYYHDRLYSKRKIHELARQADMKLVQIDYEHFFPKNRWRYNSRVDAIDKLICVSPLKIFSTNFYGVLEHD